MTKEEARGKAAVVWCTIKNCGAIFSERILSVDDALVDAFADILIECYDDGYSEGWDARNLETDRSEG